VQGSTATTYYYDGAGQLGAEYATAVAPGLCTTCYLTADHLRSTRVMTDQNGTVQALHDFLPFGEELPAGINTRGALYGGDEPNQKFTGKERDAENGLDYFGARYYSGAQGRFTSPDPVFASAAHLTDPQMWNAYAYVRNNPLRLTDPTGLDFYLTCTHTNDNASTCQQVQNGGSNVWVQGTTEANGSFTANLIGNDDNGNLIDRNHGDAAYNGYFDQSGVHLASANGTVSGQGQFVEGDPQTNVNGAGIFNGLVGQFVSACGGSCQARGSLLGDPTRAEAALNRQSGLMTAIDLLSGAHKGGTQWKDSAGYIHMLFHPAGGSNPAVTELHFEGHPTGVDVQQFVLHMVDTIRDAVSGRAKTEKDRILP